MIIHKESLKAIALHYNLNLMNGRMKIALQIKKRGV